MAEITWLDAMDSKLIDLEELRKYNTKKWLLKRTSYGKILKEDEYGIILATDIDEEGLCEITAIPKLFYKVVKKDDE